MTNNITIIMSSAELDATLEAVAAILRSSTSMASTNQTNLTMAHRALSIAKRNAAQQNTEPRPARRFHLQVGSGSTDEL